MRIPVERVLHEAGHRATEPRSAVVSDDVLDGLAKLHGPVLRRTFLGEVVRVVYHWRPMVSVQVVYRTAGTYDQVPLLPQRAQNLPDLDMEVRIVASVHGDEGCGRAAVGKHADEDEIGVVDPVEGRIPRGSQPSFVQHCNASLSCLQVGLQLVVDVFGRVDVGNRRFGWVWVGRHFDSVVWGIPVRALLSQLLCQRIDTNQGFS